MKEKIIISLLVVGAIAGIVVAARLMSGDEDAWVCVNNQWVEHGTPSAPKPATGCGVEKPIARVSFSCDAGKTIEAAFYEGESKPAASPDQPPAPGGRAALTLGDGRQTTLPQTISADGGRYANADESLVFWAKGNGAFITENGAQSYAGCIEVAPDPGGLPLSYENGAQGFSIRYPDGYMPDTSYAYRGLGPGKGISGVKFTVSTTTSAGTNLSHDSYISVEKDTKAKECTAAAFLDDPHVKAADITDNGVDYSVASSTGAGAGNRYEETVYAIPGTSPCIAVRYLVHYGVLENYPAGKVTAFDKDSLLSQFDAIRRTLVVNE